MLRSFNAILAAAFLAAALRAESYRMYASLNTSRGYVAGAKLLPSGLFQLQSGGEWRQLGFNHPLVVALDYDPRDPRILYLAAGNGCIRSADGGNTWRIMTGWEMTELKDVSVDRLQPDHIYVALPDGIGVSRDQGRTWSHADEGIRRKFTQAVRVDRTRAGRVFAGTEQGIFRSEDGGRRWQPAIATEKTVLQIEQSPGDPNTWMAATERGGAFLSRDGGVVWKPVPGVPLGSVLSNISFDPANRNRIAIAAWGPGVLVSEDAGRTWLARNERLPKGEVWRVAFDPGHPGRLYAAVHEERLYVSDDGGRIWRGSGLEGSVVYGISFVPEGKP